MPTIYAISDLHLSFGVNKPMNVFGKKWDNYEQRIKENWERRNTCNKSHFINLEAQFTKLWNFTNCWV